MKKIIFALAAVVVLAGCETSMISSSDGEHVCTDDEKTAQICTMEYLPVCGSDGETYGNGCGACAAGVESYVSGEC